MRLIFQVPFVADAPAMNALATHALATESGDDDPGTRRLHLIAVIVKMMKSLTNASPPRVQSVCDADTLEQPI